MTLAFVAEIAIKPDCFEQACDAVLGITDKTRAEDGCEAFLPHRCGDGSPTIYIYERWHDQAAFDFHHAQSYTLGVFKSYEDWLARPVRLIEVQDL